MFKELGVKIKTGMRPGDYYPTSQVHEKWNMLYQEALKNGCIITEYQNFSGTRTLQFNLNRLENDGVVVGISVFGRDITESKRLEHNLKKSNEIFFKLFNSNPISSSIADSLDNNRIIHVNEAFTKLTGYEHNEAIGRTAEDLGLYADIGDRKVILREIQRKGKAINIDLQFRKKNGEIGRGLLSAELIEIDEKPCVTVSVIDITDLEREQRNYRNIFEYAAFGICQTTIEGIYVSANPSYLKIFGYDSLEDLMTNIQNVYQTYVDPEQRKKYLRALYESGQVQSAEFERYRKDKSRIWVSSTSHVIKDWAGNILHMDNFVEDITERKQAEERLLELNAALKILLKHREEDKKELESKIVVNLKKLVNPYIEKMKTTQLNEGQRSYFSILETNLKEIMSPFLSNLIAKHINLTPREVQIINLIKEDKTSKEIANILNISTKAVDFHRGNIRSKCSLPEKANLKTYLSQLS